MNKDEIKNKINELKKKIKEAKAELKDVFESTILDFMTKNNILSFTFHVNNHEFNDGDATYFSIYFDGGSLTYKDENGETQEIEDFYDIKDKNLKTIVKDATSLFESFDIEDFYEDEYGGAYESITFKVKNDKLVVD
jgi:hypothetical protein